MKRCFKCLETKPLESFYKHAQMGDGRLNKCKDCTKADTNRNRLAKIDHYRAYDRRRASLPHRRANAMRVFERWSQAHPERRKAQYALNNAVRDGRVIPWPVCAIPECKGRPEAHHPDYERPLQVVWLCAAHHKQAHALFRKAA